jgi:hypothetical protein
MPSVVEGSYTAEVRWILPGPLEAAVAGWFARFPAGLESREDAYLLHPVLRGLSVKLRAGRMLEVKSYEGSPGILDAAGCARGRIESWRKWSFPVGPLSPGDAGPPGWAAVHKRRWITRFPPSGQRLVTDIPERATESACAAELTEVRSGGERWWSLGFEATGPAGLLRRALQDTAALMFAQALPGDVKLDLSHCQSYAEWLSRNRTPGATKTIGLGLMHPPGGGAIHPQKGEESRTRRRQDQKRSLNGYHMRKEARRG